MNPNENENPEVQEEDEAAWDQAYEALVLESFEVDQAILLLKLLEKPDLLRDSLERFVSGGDDGEEVAGDVGSPPAPRDLGLRASVS